MRIIRILAALSPPVVLLIAMLVSCAPSTSSYIHPNADLGYIQRCAILPFANLSQDSFADERLYSLFVLRIMREEVVEIVEPGAVTEAMAKLHITPGSVLSPDQILALGSELSVDGIFFGSVEEYGISRQGRSQVSHVTAVFGLVETQSGVTVWRSQVHTTGSGFFRRLFGGGSRSVHDISRTAVNRALRTLF